MSEATNAHLGEMTAEQRRQQLSTTVAEILAEWRAENPDATTIPRPVRQEMSRAVRRDNEDQRLDHAIARASVELDILKFQRSAAVGGQRRSDQSVTDFGIEQQRLETALSALEQKIHDNPLLSRTDRGHAIDALGRAFVAPRAAVRVDWSSTSGLSALKARVSERFSAIKLGIVEFSKALAPTFRAAYEHAQQQRAFETAYKAQQQRAEQPADGTDRLMPARAAAVRELADAARRWESGVADARSGNTGTDLAGLVSEFHDRLTYAQQLGIPTERINAELAATHQDAQAQSPGPQRKARFMDSIRAARGPMTPPNGASSDGPGQRFAFTAPAAGATQSQQNTTAARRTR